MKKLPLILSVVSILGVAFLLIWQFTSHGDKEVAKDQAVEEKMPSGNIAYVEIDSVILNFDMYFDLRDDLMAKQQSSEAELNTRGRQYESGARDYEDKVRKGLVTRATAAQMEQDLLQQQQDLLTLRDQLESQLLEEEQVMNRKILNYIYEFLEEFSADHDYDYILAKSFGSPLMYANDALNITDEVLKGVNSKYNKDTSNQ
ncbi:MAG TPA: OmpH family outer membrane protein [Bacteroidetes bacterium]|nr:OmpH family outer membrane protein [Bacteroidota bacterium]